MFFYLFCLVFSKENELILPSKEIILRELKNGKKITEIVELEEYKQKIPEAKELFSIMETLDAPEEDCYSTSYRKLNFDCDKLTEDEKRILTLRFTKCYFNITHRLSDFPSQYSEDQQPQMMSPSTYSVYNSFKLHITNLCFYARERTFSDQTTDALFGLFNGVVNTVKSTQNYVEAINKNSQDLLEKVKTIEEKQQQNIDILHLLGSLLENFISSIKGVSATTAATIDNLERYKFYFVILISTLIIAYFLPEILIPSILLTVLFLIIDMKLTKNVQWWDQSFVRKMMRLIYMAACSTYPVAKAILSIWEFIKNIMFSFTTNNKHKHGKRLFPDSPTVGFKSYF